MLGAYTGLHLAFFFIGVVVCLAADLFAHRGDRPITPKNALCWSVFWIALSLLFAVYVGYSHGGKHASLFLSGYFLEKSLSVDNLFVIMAIFSSFAVKEEYQHRVLYYGVIGALVLRMVFIAAGNSIVHFGGKYALAAFGLFVLWSAFKMWQHIRTGKKEIEDYSNHKAVLIAKRFVPVHNQLSGHDFFIKVEEGGRVVRKATPLFLCLLVVEMSDLVFALDSVPAVIAITREPFLVYTSNIFAILGLRSLYFLLAAAKRYLVHLEKAVVLILAYIGIKMILDMFDLIHIPASANLAVVGGLLAIGVLASLVYKESRYVV